MIEFIPIEGDDAAFLALAQRIVSGAIATLDVAEVYLVHVDNWFDFKWLGWWSRGNHNDLQELYVPPFNPNRVRSQKHFTCEADGSRRTFAGEGKRLHLVQPGFRTGAKRLDRVAKSAAFVWYSGNTVTNGAGSVMLYQSGPENYAWYASFRRDGDWTVADGARITRRELRSFEERGSQIASVD